MRLITGLPFKDTQCGFKAFRRNLALPAVILQRIEGFGFDPELLYIARKQGLKLMEIPAEWSHSEGSRVSFLRDSLKMFGDLLLIRLNDWRGRYPMPAGCDLRAGDHAAEGANACGPAPLAAGIRTNTRDEDKA
jgi:hypothetical protein